ncbi:lysylphosphatidylglycerol synthase transmembrane domain-containing protein [Microbacter sp. GSS18]|nr:lysylphosphatidylglycerol synthase transmembrane domain-containing protein [Microbacter sp. GSS18]
MRSRRLRTAVSAVVAAVLLGAIAWYVWQNWSQFSEIRLTQPWALGVAGVFVLANAYAIGSVTQAAIAPHGVDLARSELFGLAILTRFTNQFLPSYVGATIRATYLKRAHDVTYAKFSSSFLVSNILQLVVTGVLAVLVLLLMGSDISLLGSFVVAGVAVAVVTVVMAFFPAKRLGERLAASRPRGRLRRRVADRLADALTGYAVVRAEPRTFTSSLLWILVAVTTSSVVYICLYASLGQAQDIAGIVFVAIVAGWGVVLSLTPAGIGVREGIMMISAGIVGLPIAPTVVVALLMRIVTIVATGLPSLYFGPRMIHRKD